MRQSKQLYEIQKALPDASEKKNTEFFRKMVPGKQKIYGVKTPVLNELAKKYKQYAFDLAKELWNSGALEEKIIAIKILEKSGKTDPVQLLKLFKRFSLRIDNWAVCDGLGMQFLRDIVKSHRLEIFAIAKELKRKKNPWQRRLSLVMVEWYTRDKEMHKQIEQLVNDLQNDKDYYVKKAVAWIKRNLKKRT
jgi:3-methyladenine DNA glycosylase AlkD